MKKILIACLYLFCSTVHSQDLIHHTLNQTSYTKKTTKATKTFDLIESRKISNGNFISNKPFQFKKEQIMEDYKDMVSEAVFLTLEDTQLQKLRAKNRDISLIIPVSPERSFELELTKVNNTAAGFQIRTASGNNDIFSNALFYRGVVKNDAQSFAAVSIFDNEIRVLIADDGGNYVLAKVDEKKSDYILYNDRNFLPERNWKCGTPSEDVINENTASSSLSSSKSVADSRCIDIYLECDNVLYNARGGLDETINYVLGLFHEVATFYFIEDINIQISEIFIWDVSDPYNGISGCDLRNAFSVTTTNFPGFVGHLLTSKGDVGCAFGAEYCTNKSHGMTSGLDSYAPFPTYSYEVYLFCHELGHQFGSCHTQDCIWNGDNTQIDDCGNLTDDTPPSCYDSNNPIIPAGGGTVMSYCVIVEAGVGVDLNLGLGPQPGDVMRNTIDAATCLEGDCDCTLFTNRDLISFNFAPGVYVASNNIDASGEVNRPDHSPVIFRAGNSVQLSDFRAHNGSTFVASIDPDLCDFSGSFMDNVAERSNEEESNNLENEMPEENSLQLEVYPIPFTHSLNLAFNLPQPDRVSISLYNISGQLIRTFMTQNELDMGTHQFDYNVEHLPEGIYQIHFQSSKETKIQKLIKAN